MTDIEKFDRAVFEYLSSLSSKIIYAPTHNAVKTITKKEKFSDDKPWNFISFYRDSSFDVDWSRMNNPATLYGDRVSKEYIPENKTVKQKFVQNIPLNLTYDVNLWASKNTEVQEMAIALISKIYMQDQVLQVPINPEGEMGRFHILDVSWDDNSDIERETEIGKIYRHTISFTVDARLTLTTSLVDGNFQCCCGIPVDIYENH